jgi:protease-4
MAGAGVLRRLTANLARAARQGVDRALMPRGRGFWIRLRLPPALEEIRPPALPFSRQAPLGFLDVLRTLETAAGDPQVDGVLLRLEGGPRGWSKLMTLRRAVERVREAGKPVVAWGESLGSGDLLLASAATRIWLPGAGSVALLGLRADSFFVRPLLERFDVKPELLRVGRYKAAAETFTRDGLSPENREQLEAILDDLYEALVDGIAKGRGLDPGRVRALVDRGPYRASAAVEEGLVDAALYADELPERLEALTAPPPPERPGPRRFRMLEAPAYFALRASDPGWRPLLGDLPWLTYVVLAGAIRRGGGPFGVTSDSLRELLEGVRTDRNVRGVVLRIESPGGDGLASDLLWRAIDRLKREKPVVVSMGDVAASGGYYVASAADALLAEPGTLTGSIGVVGGKVDLGGLYAKVGVAKESIERGARAGMLAEDRGFTPEERAAVREEMEDFYALFLRRVAEGRALGAAELARCAEGRVWSGRRALALGLVDALGGPLEALREAARLAGLAPDERVIVDVQPRLPRIPGLRALLGLRSRQGL